MTTSISAARSDMAIGTLGHGVRPRPRILSGTTIRAETPLGTAFVTVNFRQRGDAVEPFEVFLNIGKAGSELAAAAEAIGRLCSLCLSLPGDASASERLAALINQLGGIGSARAVGFGADRIRSLPDAVAHVLAEVAESLPDMNAAGADLKTGTG